MKKAKPVSTPLASHFKLSSKQSPANENEIYDMEKVLYASTIGSLMYAMVCTRPDLAHVIGVVSRFLSNQGWIAVKWIFIGYSGISEQLLSCVYVLEVIRHY